MKKINTDFIYYTWFQDLKVIDLVDFKSINVEPVVMELQSYFDKNIDIVKLGESQLSIPTHSVPNIFEDNNLLAYADDSILIYGGESFNVDSSKYSIDKISVKYDEDYEYNNFSEYNLDADTINMHEYENINECLSQQKDCSYIAGYGFQIYLEISLKESTLSQY